MLLIWPMFHFPSEAWEIQIIGYGFKFSLKNKFSHQSKLVGHKFPLLHQTSIFSSNTLYWYLFWLLSINFQQKEVMRILTLNTKMFLRKEIKLLLKSISILCFTLWRPIVREWKKRRYSKAERWWWRNSVSKKLNKLSISIKQTNFNPHSHKPHPLPIYFKWWSSKVAWVLSYPVVSFKRKQRTCSKFLFIWGSLFPPFPSSLKSHKWWIFSIRNGPMCYLHFEYVNIPTSMAKAAWELADNKISFILFPHSAHLMPMSSLNFF
jgi:hypothetical protein